MVMRRTACSLTLRRPRRLLVVLRVVSYVVVGQIAGYSLGAAPPHAGRAHDGCSSSLIMAIQLWGASSPSMMP